MRSTHFYIPDVLFLLTFKERCKELLRLVSDLNQASLGTQNKLY